VTLCDLFKVPEITSGELGSHEQSGLRIQVLFTYFFGEAMI
jgi:hypothetical protein